MKLAAHWRVIGAEEARRYRCRFGAGPHHPACGKRPVAACARTHGRDPRGRWWHYCLRHVREYGNEIVDGVVIRPDQVIITRGPRMATFPIVDLTADPPETEDQMMTRLDLVMLMIRAELAAATLKFGPFASAHEGYAVILEELDELWDEVKNNKAPGARDRQRNEARQVAAMAARFLLDLPAE